MRSVVWSEEEGGKVRFGSRSSRPISVWLTVASLLITSSHIPFHMKCATAATLAIFALAASARDEKPCTVHDEGGTYYDLSGLSAK